MLPAPEKIHCRREACPSKGRAAGRELESRPQKSARQSRVAARAAALRLKREVGRLLRCLDAAAALSSNWLRQSMRRGRSRRGSRKAKEWLGGRLTNLQLAWELEQFLKTLTPNDQRSRLSGSSIDAALRISMECTPSDVKRAEERKKRLPCAAIHYRMRKTT